MYDRHQLEHTAYSTVLTTRSRAAAESRLPRGAVQSNPSFLTARGFERFTFHETIKIQDILEGETSPRPRPER